MSRFGPSSDVGDPGGQCVWLAGETARAAAWQLGVQHVDGCLRLQVNMLTQLDLDKASPFQPADEAVVAKVLAHAVRYSHASIRVISKCIPTTNTGNEVARIHQVVLYTWPLN